MPAISTAGDIITDALIEIGALAPGETPSGEESATCLRKLQRLLDQWAARRVMVYSLAFPTFTLPTNVLPVTIGPTQASAPQPLVVIPSQRPVKIVAANILLNVSPIVRQPLNIRDAAWWAAQRTPNISTTLPTDLYYSPDWPLGSLYFWPTSTVSYTFELEVWTLLSQIAAISDPVNLPPGYWDALVYALAVHLLPSFEKPPNPALVQLAMRSLAAVQENNAAPPRIQSADFGMSPGAKRATFNYYTGQ